MNSSTASKLGSLAGLTSAKRVVLKLALPDSSAHAVLLYGAEGSGKAQLANALAQAWLCTSPGDDGACGECQSCQAFERDRNADLLHIVPAPPSNIIRRAAISPMPFGDPFYDMSLIEYFRTRPLSARHKVVIITDAERMNNDAANAFLKTLEEPEPFAKMILTTPNVGAVLPTILSRCLAVACELPSRGSKSEMLDILSEGAPGRRAHIEAHLEPYRAIYETAERLGRESPGRALALGEEFRSACEGLEKSLDCGARAANVEALRTLGASIAALHRRPDWMAVTAEAHRRILGNGSPGVVIDAAFARMLVP